ncbi:DUF4231 domain-containing protein [Kitasatospora sp. NPDC058965]|uniref:DUF4231 domain-containing protein n=1 Tax=Kitasatospora sp. NPDC058965 TaxID=3346682 RepID=UPI0036AFE7B6
MTGGFAGAGLTAVETAGHLLARIRQGNAYARTRKKRFRLASSALRLLTLTLSAASTVILGLQNLSFWAGLAFALVAVVTLLGAVESFFNWRSRWILLEETQYRFRRLADDLEYLVASTPADALTHAQLKPLFDEYQAVWAQLGERWLAERRSVAGQ